MRKNKPIFWLLIIIFVLGYILGTNKPYTNYIHIGGVKNDTIFVNNDTAKVDTTHVINQKQCISIVMNIDSMTTKGRVDTITFNID